MNTPPLKQLLWVASSKRDFKEFPAEVQNNMGRALRDAQFGGTPLHAKPLKGFIGAGVLELIEDHDRSTYRAVYTVRFEGVVYVLHAFQKKSTHGIATPKHELELIRNRYRVAEADYRSRGGRP